MPKSKRRAAESAMFKLQPHPIKPVSTISIEQSPLRSEKSGIKLLFHPLVDNREFETQPKQIAQKQ